MGGQSAAVNGVLDGLPKTRPVGQTGLAVPVSEFAYLGLLRPNVQAHVVKGSGESTDFIFALQVLHGRAVVAPGQQFGG